ncbi:hypothetical protein M1M97_01890 [Thermodesulfovibrionales bacterium]|nr:hypothetical protein [Thermodesulfovibrionales bacterium]
MPVTIEELEYRVSKLENLYGEVLRERLIYISERVDHLSESLIQLHKKTEKDKTEILIKTERDKTEILTKTERDKAEILTKTEKDKTEILTQLYEKTERDKREFIYWISGLVLGFSVLTITAVWAILSFALR